MNTETCPNCGTPLVHTPGRRPKKFCSNNCRSLYWQKMNAKVKKNNLPENKARILAERETPPDTTTFENPVTPEELIMDGPDLPNVEALTPEEGVTVTEVTLPPLVEKETFPPAEPGGYFDLPVSPPLQQGKGFDYYVEKIPELMYEPEFKAMATEIDNDPGLTQKQKDLLKIKMRTANL